MVPDRQSVEQIYPPEKMKHEKMYDYIREEHI